MYSLTASHLMIENLENTALNSLSPKLLVVFLLCLLEHHVALLILAAQSSCAVVGSTLRTLPD